MKILNANNKTVGKVITTKDVNRFDFNGQNIYASSLSHACEIVCNKLGDGHFYLLFTI